jgi:pimeloyl-ACP methyl ester carboxylesterase
MPSVEVDDAVIAYRVQGGGSPVLLLQGVGVAGRGWKPQIEALHEHHRLCAVDNRGVGESTGRPTTVEAMADDALAVMDALGWRRAHLVGHSMGGSIAQSIALRHPERVESLALLCSLSRGHRVVRFDPGLIWRQLCCQIGTRAMRCRAFFRLVSPRAAWADADDRIPQLEDVFGRSLVDVPPVTMAQVSAVRRFDAYDQLGELRALPSLVLSATEDPIAPPSEGRALADALGTELVEVAGSHAVTIQDAPRINALLRQHLARADQRGARSA